MNAGEVNFIQSQADYQWTPNLRFKDKKMTKIRNKIESNLSRILFISLALSILGYFIR